MTAQMSTQTTVRITQTKAGHNSRETTITLSHLSTRVYTPKLTHYLYAQWLQHWTSDLEGLLLSHTCPDTGISCSPSTELTCRDVIGC